MDKIKMNPERGPEPAGGPDIEAFRQEVRAFIRQALPAELRARVERGYDLLSREDHTLWQKQLQARGWGAPGWPVEFGGTGWSAAQRQAFDDECGRASCPRTQPQGLKMVGPIIYTHGTEEQKRRFLPPIVSADEWWCQGYSEPGAGSDLAALSTRAVREGDYYRVTGQKTWTTLAHWADWMFCLVRTDASGRRQEGITFLLIDMKTPGITVRPIKSLDLAHHFNEVFLNDVMVPVANRIGEEGRGWTYAKALLAHERAGIAEIGRARERLDRLKRLARDPAIGAGRLLRDDAFRTKVAQIEVEMMAAEATTLRLLEGKTEPALSSVLKLRSSELTQQLSRMNLDALGPHALRLDLEQAERPPQADDPLPSFGIGRSVEYLRWRALTVAGGTSEVQRNIIAKLAFGD
jgi:alkylation response protein AidB-like acyl-CoA dehydrogenase